MRLTKRLHSPPPPERKHGVLCRIKTTLSPSPSIKTKFLSWAGCVDDWWFRITKANKIKRASKAPASYDPYNHSLPPPPDMKQLERERVTRARYDKHQDDKLQEMEAKRHELDRKIQRQANQMRWERETRPHLDPASVPRVQKSVISYDGAADDAAPALTDEFRSFFFRMRRRESHEERELRHHRERVIATADSEGARRTLWEYGVSVRDFQVEFDETHHRSLTDIEARVLEERRQRVLEAYNAAGPSAGGRCE